MRSRVLIEKLVYGGSGLARRGDATVFVPFVLPGEEVLVDLPDHVRGTLHRTAIALNRRSPHRAEAPCPVFAKCGGCHYQHIPYERERDFKVEILRETLRRIGGLQWGGEIKVLTATPWGYRNRTQLRVGRTEGRAATGFFAPRAHRHVATHDCAINSPKLNELHRALQRMASAPGFPKSIRTVEFFTNEESVQMNFPRRSGPFPRRFWARCSDQLGVSRAGMPLYYQSGSDRFRVSARSFFQVNRFLVDKLAELAIGSMKGRLALDLYCGVGLLTLPLARRFEEVIGVDAAASAVRDLDSNATKAGLSLRAVHRDVAAFLTVWTRRPSLVVADPPRAGLGRAIVAQILRLAPPRIQLVSCDPATLARDIKALVAGGYRVKRLALIDLFPQTYHFETVAALRLR